MALPFSSCSKKACSKPASKAIPYRKKLRLVFSICSALSTCQLMGSISVTQSTRSQRTVTLCRAANRCTMLAPFCQTSAKEAPTTCPTRARRRPAEIEKNKIIFFSPASPTGTKSSSALRSEEHTSELQSRGHLVCRLLLEKKKKHRL